MSDAAAARRSSWPGLLFGVALIPLLLWNLYVGVRNQRGADPTTQPAVRLVTRDIAGVARRASYDAIWATYRWYYQLRALGHGTTIVLSPEMAGHRFYLEEVSRLGVEVATAPTVVEQHLIDHVDGDHEMLDGTRPCVIAVEPGATRYLVARTADFKSYVVLTEARLREALAWYRAELSRRLDWQTELVEHARPDSLPFRWYFRMRELGAGTTVVVPPEMAGHRPYLEGIAHLRVEVAAASPEVDARIVAHVAPATRDMLDWVRDGAVVVDPGATRYVVVRTGDFKLYLVMSEGRYRQEQAWLAAAPASTRP